MDRRAFVSGITLGLLAAPLAAEAQQATKIHRIGFLSPSSSADPSILDAFREGLREVGYVEGQNITIASRWAEGKYDRLPGLAAQLVGLKVDIIVATAVPAIRAAKEATRTIPIIMAVVVDPMATGLVASLARPGGNITGLSSMAPQMTGKQLEMLKEVVPKASLVAVLWNPANAGNAPQIQQAQDAARALGVRLQPLGARGSSEIDSAFATMTSTQSGAVIVLVDAMLLDHRTQIADLAAQRRLPAVYGLRDHAAAGGLMAYGPNRLDIVRRAATFVDKILKGAKPGDLPVEQPTKFELIINLKTAKALGLTIPPSLLQRADQVIE
jgi:putative tryptophan/tyrosine transport system substrate-binding protein